MIILDRYKLKPNNVILADDGHKNLCKELTERYQVDYTAGGSAMNVMRVIAAIYRDQSIDAKVIFSGCIGNDKFGETMNEKATEDGVVASFAVSQTVPTGTCAVCLTDQGKNRSLCAFLGASQKFTDQHLRDNWSELVEHTDIIYISGFLIAVSPETFQLLGEHIAKSADNSKRFCLNLSAPYVSQAFGKDIEKILKYVDIVFGNDDEARAFAEFKKYNVSTVDEIAKMIVLEPKERTKIGRLVVITKGERPIVVAQQLENGQVEVKHYEVDTIPDNDIVDTNGAGDAFAGGFVSQLALGKSLEACVKVGSWAAREVIKVSGISVRHLTHVP